MTLSARNLRGPSLGTPEACSDLGTRAWLLWLLGFLKTLEEYCIPPRINCKTPLIVHSGFLVTIGESEPSGCRFRQSLLFSTAKLLILIYLPSLYTYIHETSVCANINMQNTYYAPVYVIENKTRIPSSLIPIDYMCISRYHNIMKLAESYLAPTFGHLVWNNVLTHVRIFFFPNLIKNRFPSR